MFKSFITKIYNSLLTCFCINPTSNNIPSKRKLSKEDFDRELHIGIAIEMEHTKNRAVAKDIAMDHLHDNPDYYKKY